MYVGAAGMSIQRRKEVVRWFDRLPVMTLPIRAFSKTFAGPA